MALLARQGKSGLSLELDTEMRIEMVGRTGSVLRVCKEFRRTEPVLPTFYFLRVNTSKLASLLVLVAADLRAAIVASPSERRSHSATKYGRSEIGRYLRIPRGLPRGSFIFVGSALAPYRISRVQSSYAVRRKRSPYVEHPCSSVDFQIII